MGRLFALVLGLIVLPVVSAAQDTADAATLGEIRSEIRALTAELEALRRATLTSNGGTASRTTPLGPIILRIDQMEADIRALTGQVERFGNRVDRVVEDGTRRLADLDFRLTELEGGDLAAVGSAPALGETAEASKPGLDRLPPAPARPRTAVPEQQPQAMATSQEGNFNAAMAALMAGDHANAILGFGTFVADYPASPLAMEARYHLGLAQAGAGQHRDAARSFLDLYVDQPQGLRAPAALLGVGRALVELGQTVEACRTFGEIRVKWPDRAEAREAQLASAPLGCG